jgi:hypothetical protein
MKEEVKQSLELIIRGLESLRLTREERAIFDNAFKILTTELTTSVEVTEEQSA